MPPQCVFVAVMAALCLGLPARTWAQLVDPASTLECHRREYSYKVTKADSEGRICWDIVKVMSCWGRCDSNEISDWRFPYKRSYHPVCLHDTRVLMRTELSNCEPGTQPGTETYEYLHALSCRCAVCKSSEASCEGLRYRGQRSGAFFSSSSSSTGR